MSRFGNSSFFKHFKEKTPGSTPVPEPLSDRLGIQLVGDEGFGAHIGGAQTCQHLRVNGRIRVNRWILKLRFVRLG